MPTSQNGWPVLETAPPVVTVPGCAVRFRVRPGDVAVIFADLVHLFDRNVEDVDTAGHPGVDPLPKGDGAEPSTVADDWGWAYRPIRGRSTGFSNHASGTALDLNATQHPRGVQHTFTPAQRRAVRQILSRYVDPLTGRCVVRWGEDYVHDPENGRYVDGMHFEINSGQAAVERVVDRLHRLDQPLPVPTDPPAPAGATTKGIDMFLAAVPGDDKRVFLVTGTGKMLVPDGETLADLRRLGIVDKGEVAVRTLNMFPTVNGTPAEVSEILRRITALETASRT